MTPERKAELRAITTPPFYWGNFLAELLDALDKAEREHEKRVTALISYSTEQINRAAEYYNEGVDLRAKLARAIKALRQIASTGNYNVGDPWKLRGNEMLRLANDALAEAGPVPKCEHCNGTGEVWQTDCGKPEACPSGCEPVPTEGAKHDLRGDCGCPDSTHQGCFAGMPESENHPRDCRWWVNADLNDCTCGTTGDGR